MPSNPVTDLIRMLKRGKPSQPVATAVDNGIHPSHPSNHISPVNHPSSGLHGAPVPAGGHHFDPKPKTGKPGLSLPRFKSLRAVFGGLKWVSRRSKSTNTSDAKDKPVGSVEVGRRTNANHATTTKTTKAAAGPVEVVRTDAVSATPANNSEAGDGKDEGVEPGALQSVPFASSAEPDTGASSSSGTAESSLSLPSTPKATSPSDPDVVSPFDDLPPFSLPPNSLSSARLPSFLSNWSISGMSLLGAEQSTPSGRTPQPASPHQTPTTHHTHNVQPIEDGPRPPVHSLLRSPIAPFQLDILPTTTDTTSEIFVTRDIFGPVILLPSPVISNSVSINHGNEHKRARSLSAILETSEVDGTVAYKLDPTPKGLHICTPPPPPKVGSSSEEVGSVSVVQVVTDSESDEEAESSAGSRGGEANKSSLNLLRISPTWVAVAEQAEDSGWPTMVLPSRSVAVAPVIVQAELSGLSNSNSVSLSGLLASLPTTPQLLHEPVPDLPATYPQAKTFLERPTRIPRRVLPSAASARSTMTTSRIPKLAAAAAGQHRPHERKHRTKATRRGMKASLIPRPVLGRAKEVVRKAERAERGRASRIPRRRGSTVVVVV